eukprot:6584565-Prymnesium_polylepis.1
MVARAAEVALLLASPLRRVQVSLLRSSSRRKVHAEDNAAVEECERRELAQLVVAVSAVARA